MGSPPSEKMFEFLAANGTEGPLQIITVYRNNFARYFHHFGAELCSLEGRNLLPKQSLYNTALAAFNFEHALIKVVYSLGISSLVSTPRSHVKDDCTEKIEYSSSSSSSSPSLFSLSLPLPKKEVMFLVRSVCLFVCLSVGLLANL